MEKVLEFYGIDKADSIAFGDGNNDIEMFGAVGTGVAMANASDRLKAVAANTCRDVKRTASTGTVWNMGCSEKACKIVCLWYDEKEGRTIRNVE